MNTDELREQLRPLVKKWFISGAHIAYIDVVQTPEEAMFDYVIQVFGGKRRQAYGHTPAGEWLPVPMRTFQTWKKEVQS